MGLLIDKYNEYLEKLRGVNLRDDDDFSGMDSDFNTSMGDGIKASLRERKSPLMDNPLFPTNIVPPGEGKINVAGASIPIIPKSAMGKQNVEFAKNNKIAKQDASKTEAPDIMKTGTGSKLLLCLIRNLKKKCTTTTMISQINVIFFYLKEM